MHVFITAIGSRGDVQPYIALGKGLRAAGHSVTLSTTSNFASWVVEHGLAYGYLSDDLLKLMGSEAGKSAFESSKGVFRSLATYRRLIRDAGPIHPAEDGPACARSCRSGHPTGRSWG